MVIFFYVTGAKKKLMETNRGHICSWQQNSVLIVCPISSGYNDQEEWSSLFTISSTMTPPFLMLSCEYTNLFFLIEKMLFTGIKGPSIYSQNVNTNRTIKWEWFSFENRTSKREYGNDSILKIGLAKENMEVLFIYWRYQV